MPIDRDVLEEGSPVVRPGTNKHRVLTFLAAGDDKAYTRKEVAEGAGVSADSVGPVLSRLRDEGLVEYNDGYWAVLEDERLGVLASLLEEVDDLAERFDRDDFPAWMR